ncbi:MAG: HAMP domain-containing sensor histidine kinase [Bacilli bacterium]
MFATVFTSINYLLFPIMIYFLYLVYSKVVDTSEKKVFFDLALLSSYYSCLRFVDNTTVTFFLLNLPLVVALYKKRKLSGFLLSLGMVLFSAKVYSLDLYLFLIQYLIIYVLCILVKKNIVNVFIIVKVLFGLIIIFFLPTKEMNIDNLLIIIFCWLIMYLILKIIITVFCKVENVVKMHQSINQITKEKTLYESLFKITHEIKNPLAVCKGYLDMIDVNNYPAKANKFIGIINQEVDRTLVLLKDFSDISKIKIVKDKMDISMLVEDVCDESKMLFNNKVKLTCNVFSKECFVNGDYNRLKQVLINLLKNAKEAVEEVGVVNFKTVKNNNYYVITISDNGVGMDTETFKQFGEPFFTTKKLGTGLGVCFSKEILDKHNAIIEYESKKGVGTVVTIKIPIIKGFISFNE